MNARAFSFALLLDEIKFFFYKKDYQIRAKVKKKILIGFHGGKNVIKSQEIQLKITKLILHWLL